MMEAASERLKHARTRAGFSSAVAFAREKSLPEVTYRAHESGTRNFKIDSAKAYAKALGVTWQWLMFGDEHDPAVASAAIDGLTPVLPPRCRFRLTI